MIDDKFCDLNPKIASLDLEERAVPIRLITCGNGFVKDMKIPPYIHLMIQGFSKLDPRHFCERYRAIDPLAPRFWGAWCLGLETSARE